MYPGSAPNDRRRIAYHRAVVAPSERAPLCDRAAAALAMLALALGTTAVACAQVLGVDDWADSTSSGAATQGAGGASQGPSSSASAFGGQSNGASTASSNDGGSTSTTGPASTTGASGGSSSMSSASATASASSSDASSSSASTGVVCDDMACEASYPDNGCTKGICDPTSGCIPVYYNEGGGCSFPGGSGSCSGGICLCGSTSDCFMVWCMFPDTICCVSGSCICQPEWGSSCP
jgi:hypothetical protein